MESILLERHHKSEFTVNYEGKRYVWAGSKGNMISKKAVPRDVYDYLAMFTTTFKDGELIISESQPKETVEELKDNMYEKEDYEANALTKDTVIKILKGTVKNMEKELNKITSDTTKRFVLSVAKEIGLDNFTKQKFIKEWLGFSASIEELFDMD